MFVEVAVFFQGGCGIERQGDFAGGLEDHGGGDEVPGLDGDDVGGEEVEFVDGVGVLGEIVAAELAEVSGAVAGAAGFDLYSQEAARAVVDADVVGQGVSPGLEDVISRAAPARWSSTHSPHSEVLNFSLRFIHPTLVRPKMFGPNARPNVVRLYAGSYRKHKRRDRWAAPF